ncbi:unnamed protein product [Orchesella dallaii]|uniref:C2H2-type domain-containing protein n=1 Tax=Orchesella dallaii TaxID=48710 RepID=A0ABP1RZY0_9HEXA
MIKSQSEVDSDLVGEMKRESNFQIDTKGSCFLCLKLPSKNNDSDCGPLKKYSFRQLSRYLNLDFLKIFNTSASLHRFSNSALEDAEVTITICVDCCDIVNKFSVFYEELERIQGELNDCVRQVHHIMVSAERNPSVVQQYRQRMLRRKPAQLIEASVVEKLREETIQNCFRKAIASNAVVRKEKHHAAAKNPPVKPTRSESVLAKGNASSDGKLRRTPYENASSQSDSTLVQVKKDPDAVTNIIDLCSDDELDTREPAIKINSLVDRNGMVYSASGENITPIPSPSFYNYSSNSDLSAADATINEFLFPALPSRSSCLNRNRPLSSSLFSFPKPKVEYKCEFCDKVSYSRGNMEQHKRQHTGEKPFHCIHCDGRFVSQNTLKTHIVRDHRELLFSQFKEPRTTPHEFKAAVDHLFENYKRSNDRTRPYLCAHCDIQGYLHKRDLQAHMFQYHFDLLASKLQNFQKASMHHGTPQQPYQGLTTGSLSVERAQHGEVKRMRHLEYW